VFQFMGPTTMSGLLDGVNRCDVVNSSKRGTFYTVLEFQRGNDTSDFEVKGFGDLL
jgi:hypothetical protein